MHAEVDDSVSCLFTLLRYKQLSEDVSNHPEIIKDKTAITFLAYVLDTSNPEILDASLTTLELLSNNAKNRETIKSTSGILEGLETLVKNSKSVNPEMCFRAESIIKSLNTPNLPLKDVSGKDKNKSPKKKKVLILQVFGLHLETQKDLEDTLTKTVKGVLSLMIDVEHQRCIVTVFEHVDPKTLAAAISHHTKMEAKLVIRNKYNQEVLVELSENESLKTLELETLPPYLDEKDSPVKEKAVRSIKDIRITASEWFSSAAGFLQKSFYW